MPWARGDGHLLADPVVAEGFSASDRDERVDVVIVGTGPGGAAAARVLSARGARVLLLEEGPAQMRFARNQGHTMRYHMQEGGAMVAQGNAYTPIAAGRGVGGGSLVNSAIAWRCPDAVLDEWTEALGDDRYGPAAMRPVYDELWELLGIWPTREEISGNNNDLIVRGVRALGLDLLIALALMVAGTVVGWLLVASDPDWYFALMPGGLADTRVPGASRAVLLGTLFGQQNETGLGVFAAALFSNNAQVSILAFALGFAFGLPTVLLLIQNTALLGALLWLYHGQGLTLELVGWLSVHGTTELFAILLAGAAGIHIGRAMAFPGEAAVLDAAAAAGRRSAPVMIGVVLMLIAAGLLEGFARQLIDNTAGRLSVGGFMLVLWTGYFFVWRGNSASNGARDDEGESKT